MDKDTVETIQRVHDLFRKGKLTLAVAESCTGGLVSHYLTSLPGASDFFVGGLVAYSADAKERVLGVPPGVIARSGVVSEETAREMAVKVRALLKTDCGLSTTGNLGPGALEGKGRGLVYIAVSREGETFSRELRLTGDRTQNKENAALSALKLLIGAIDPAS